MVRSVNKNNYMLLKIFRFLQFSLKAIAAVSVSIALFFSYAESSFAGQYLTISPSQVKVGGTITFSVNAPNAAGSYVCVSSAQLACVPQNFIVLPPGGRLQNTYTASANDLGTTTYTLHLYFERDLNTELATYRDTASLTVLPADTVTPPATVTPIPSDLNCPLGLPKDSATGLCLPTNPLTPATGSIVASSSVGQLIQRILDILLTLAGVIAILFIVLGGYQYITSRGAEDQAKAGRKTMTYAILGLIAVLLAYTGVNLVVRLITTGTLFG